MTFLLRFCRYLPTAMGKLSRLVTLDASYNQIEVLPAEIGLCRSVSTMTVTYSI